MGCNWSIAPLRSFVTELFKGIAPKYVFMDDKGAIPVLGQKCVRNFEIDMSQARFTDSFAKPVKQEKLLQKYDILINATGVGSAGRVAQLRDAVPNCTVDGHVIVLRATGIDPLYLGYALKQKQPIIEQLAEGSTGQTEMNRRRLQDEILISFPKDRDNQRKTASVLANLDAQIANLNRTNGYLLEMMGERCKSAFEDEHDCALHAVCSYVNDKTSAANAESSTYVSTESLISGKGGRQLAASLPKSGKVTVYKAGDTLVSNIRPYFKKIWFADMDGTCSTDVLVFRAKNPGYKSLLFFALYSDDFFAHLVAGSKGTKMPRGDKNQAMHYGIPTFGESLKQLASQANHVLALVSNNSHQAKALAELRDVLLPKLMSGEIDVSKVKLPTQPNSHLSD